MRQVREVERDVAKHSLTLACMALQAARKCSGSSSSQELHSLHVGLPMGLPSLLAQLLRADLAVIGRQLYSLSTHLCQILAEGVFSV